MKTQHQMFESSRRWLAGLTEFIGELSQMENAPTKEELKKLREKNPKTWNLFPEKLAK
jgi:hypothetical protein